MERLTELKPVFVEFCPPPGEKEHGVLYISKRFKLVIHLCACGCGVESVTPIDNAIGGWILSEHGNNIVSLSPSIGNFNGESPYHAHYFITENKINWC